MSQIATDKFVSEGNVRATETIDTAEFNSLKANIKKIGIVNPITYRINEDGEFVITDGHQRVEIAKRLKLKEIPAYEVNGTVDDITKQISANMMRVSSSPFDGAFAIMQLVDNGVIKNRKDLSAHFGKSIAWVDEALMYTNLSKYIIDSIKSYLKGDNVLNSQHKSDLKIISQVPISTQERVMLDYLGCDEEDEIEEYLDVSNPYTFAGYLEDIALEVTPDKDKWNYIKKTIGEETFREYETNHDIEHVFQNNLFQEYADEQWCDDTDFLQEVFLNETEIGQYFQELDLSIHHDYNSMIPYRFEWTKLRSFKSNLVKHINKGEETKVKFNDLMLDHWNGNVFSPVVYVQPPVSEDEAKTAIEKGLDHDDAAEEYAEAIKSTVVKNNEEDPFKKFRKRAYEFLDDHCNKYLAETMPFVMCANDSNGLNIVLKWIVQDLDREIFIGKPNPYLWDKKDYHPCFEFLETNKDENNLPLDNNSLIEKMATFWFEEHYESATIKEKDLLLEYNNRTCFQDWFTELYQNNEDVRKGWISLFTKDVLTEVTDVTAKTKSEIVDALVMSDGLTKSIVCEDLLNQLL